MSVNAEDYRTPGQLLTAALKNRGWTGRLFATVAGLSESSVSKMLSDTQAITAEMAVMFEELFDGNPNARDFLELQVHFDLNKARYARVPDPNRATRAYIYAGLPVGEMIKRGWLKAMDARDVSGVESSLEEFFGAPLAELPILPNAAKMPHASYKTEVGKDATPAQIAWLYRVIQIAEDMLVAPYSEAACHTAIRKLSELRGAPEDVRRVPRILTEAGIRYVIVEGLPKARIDGVCVWLNDVSPVIGMSMRFDRIDNFWFVLRHELEHVLNGHGKSVSIIDTEMEASGASADHILAEERIANVAAAEFCVPQSKLMQFISRKGPFYAERDIIGFAEPPQSGQEYE